MPMICIAPRAFVLFQHRFRNSLNTPLQGTFKILETLPKICEPGEAMWLPDQRLQSFRLGSLRRNGEEGFCD
jgi:hypothetical protein